MIDRDPTPIPRAGVVPLAVLGVLLLVLVAHTMAYHDAEREHAHYCEMVADGHWPDYKRLDCDEPATD